MPFQNPEVEEGLSAIKDNEIGSGGFGKHLQKMIKGFIRFLTPDERFDLKEVKAGIGFGIKFYSKPFMNPFDEVVS